MKITVTHEDVQVIVEDSTVESNYNVISITNVLDSITELVKSVKSIPLSKKNNEEA